VVTFKYAPSPRVPTELPCRTYRGDEVGIEIRVTCAGQFSVTSRLWSSLSQHARTSADH
jgi:hypothetical protein